MSAVNASPFGVGQDGCLDILVMVVHNEKLLGTIMKSKRPEKQ